MKKDENEKDYKEGNMNDRGWEWRFLCVYISVSNIGLRPTVGVKPLSSL